MFLIVLNGRKSIAKVKPQRLVRAEFLAAGGMLSFSVLTWRTSRKQAFWGLLGRTLIPSLRLQPHDLIASKGPAPENILRRRFKFQYVQQELQSCVLTSSFSPVSFTSIPAPLWAERNLSYRSVYCCHNSRAPSLEHRLDLQEDFKTQSCLTSCHTT